MDRTKIYELIDKKLKQGQTIEEIYVEYDTLFTELLEIPFKEKTKEQMKREDEYLEIREAVATYAMHKRLLDKGYTCVWHKKFGKWEKKERVENNE